ncbi:hypothetical protein AB0910_06865 [Streptomyces sp. NPDC047002]|uniref:hypothetical protein n=1 Tax=Streptomyces sp. NPDC047002 TaxID=3155475 RepID=UPI00345626DB
MARPAVPRTPALIPALALGGAWWWAVVRLALAPERTGAVERVVVAGGWGLSLLPVHVASRSALAAERAARDRRRRDRARGPREPGFAMPYTPYEGGYGYGYGPADYGGYGDSGYGPEDGGCGPGYPYPYGADPYGYGYGPEAGAPGEPPYGPGPGPGPGEPPCAGGPYPYGPYEGPGGTGNGDDGSGGAYRPPGAR